VFIPKRLGWTGEEIGYQLAVFYLCGTERHINHSFDLSVVGENDQKRDILSCCYFRPHLIRARLDCQRKLAEVLCSLDVIDGGGLYICRWLADGETPQLEVDAETLSYASKQQVWRITHLSRVEAEPQALQ